MVKTVEDLERLLSRLDRRYERLEDGTLLVVVGPGQPLIALRLAPPVLVAQVTIGDAPKADAQKEVGLFRRLLELNAVGLVHAAYGIENTTIVLSSALELESLDLNELEAVLADIDVALVEHVPDLRKLVDS